MNNVKVEKARGEDLYVKVFYENKEVGPSREELRIWYYDKLELVNDERGYGRLSEGKTKAFKRIILT